MFCFDYTSWSWLLDHPWYQNDFFVEWIIKNPAFLWISDTCSVEGCWGQLMLLFWELINETQMGKTPEPTRHHNSRISFYPSEPFTLDHFTMRHPVYNKISTVFMPRYVQCTHKVFIMCSSSSHAVAVPRLWPQFCMRAQYSIYFRTVRPLL